MNKSGYNAFFKKKYWANFMFASILLRVWHLPFFKYHSKTLEIETPPNIILILVNDLGCNDVSFCRNFNFDRHYEIESSR